MGVCFRPNFNWVFSFHSRTFTNSSSWPSSYFFRGDASYDGARISLLVGERENLYTDHLRARTCSSPPQILEDDYTTTEEIKMSRSNMLCSSLYGTIDYNLRIRQTKEDDNLTFLTKSLEFEEVIKASSEFSILMKNLVVLEEIFTDSDVITLESDILKQLERLGALHLFHTFLTRSLDISNDPAADYPIDNIVNDDQAAKVVVSSGKKEERNKRSERRLENAKKGPLSLKDNNHKQRPKLQNSYSASTRRSSNYRVRRRLKHTMNEAEMSKGVKLISDLEKIRMRLEKEAGGEIASLSRWAKAARVEKKVLQENLQFGWYCKDELLRSTRSLVSYIARSYRGMGVGFDDLLQAGYVGVLQGAERFDHTRGYKFSTYVQYWVRKSMSKLVANHSRGIRIPLTLRNAISKIQKARKALYSGDKGYPNDLEIAKLTGLSMAKVKLAAKCSRVVCSIDQEIGSFHNSAKIMEVTADTTIMTPEEYVKREHLRKELNELLNGLKPREKQVLILRFGLHDHQGKSLEEIGKLFSVTKEWIRKIEKAAFAKLRDGKTCKNLSYYLYM